MVPAIGLRAARALDAVRVVVRLGPMAAPAIIGRRAVRVPQIVRLDRHAAKVSIPTDRAIIRPDPKGAADGRPDSTDPIAAQRTDRLGQVSDRATIVATIDRGATSSGGSTR